MSCPLFYLYGYIALHSHIKRFYNLLKCHLKKILIAISNKKNINITYNTLISNSFKYDIIKSNKTISVFFILDKYGTFHRGQKFQKFQNEK